MKVALVHDHLVQDGGAEKVLRVLQDIWPQAPTFTLFYDRRAMPGFEGRDIRTSFLQRMPGILKKYQWYISLMPAATESYDLREFDVVISNASAFSKGVLTRPDALHVCYCHTPTRYLWSDTHSYVQELRVPRFVKAALPTVLSRLRLWDRAAAERVDHFIANSETVRRRIRKYYHRDSEVIHPPVDVDDFFVSPKPPSYFLIGGRLVAYKRFDIVVEAFNRTGLPLKIFGTGPIQDELRRQVKPNIQFLGRVADKDMPDLFAHCQAFLYPQEEDFGLTAVEAMAAGRPVIAYRRGGATETVVEGVTGTFIEDQTWEEVAHATLHFDSARYDSARIRAHAEKFGTHVFQERLRRLVEDAWSARCRAEDGVSVCAS
ncbi:glycosyltransferase [Candidatus Uhrbacteria bacterium]|nr:glycosyltransferase [Candidatus Uhrbacteria bacterium]